MPDWPVVPLYVFLVVVATARGGATYLVGRGARGVLARRWRLDAPWIARGEDLVRRFGAPAVTLSFLTVGIQTAVNLGAGSLRMPARRYVPALVLGGLLWATVYLAVGAAVVAAFWAGGRGWLLLLALVGLLALTLGIRRLLRSQVPASAAPLVSSPTRRTGRSPDRS